MSDKLILDDAALSETGLDLASATPSAPGSRVLLIACGALAHEIVALRRMNGWSYVDLRCLPALWHNTPQKIPEGISVAIRKGRAQGYAKIFVVYADCGTGGLLDQVCREEEVERIAGPHCYSFFSGNDAFSKVTEAGEITAFYLTDFLVRQFDTVFWRGLGLDRHPELRDIYFGNYEKAVYLAQIDDEALDRKAEAAAAKMGLAYERRFTGYGDLASFLAAAAER